MRSDEWATPPDLFKVLEAEFKFTLDVCASEENYKVLPYIDAKRNGLIQSWKGERCFCNPPYGGLEIPKWVRKCSSGEAALVVALLPAKTDTRWFHDFILGKAEVRFLKGRVKFVGAPYNAPFPSVVVIWK